MIFLMTARIPAIAAMGLVFAAALGLEPGQGAGIMADGAGAAGKLTSAFIRLVEQVYSSIVMRSFD
jgi:hypothetical protein